jgi:tetratricopeptide (TPR) repeat protein
MRTSRIARLAGRLAFAVVALLPLHAAAQASDALAQARRWIESREPARAYALLAPLEGERAGDPEFDFVFAVAALESGHLDRAAIALDRVLVRKPDSDAARLELGRVYLRMGSLDLAAQEFTRLLPRAPDAAARALLAAYLEEIRRAKERQRYARWGYVELGGGRDSNISSTTSDFTNAIQSSFGLPGIQPTGNSIRRGDRFAAFNAAGEMAYRISEQHVAFVAGGARLRRYAEFNDYDYRLGDLLAGFQSRDGEIVKTATVFAQAFRQDGALGEAIEGSAFSNDRDAYGLGLEAKRLVAAGWSAALGLQLAFTRYPDNPGQDTRQVTMSAALEHRPSWWAEGAFVARMFYGHDEARRTLNPFTEATASRHTHGVRIFAMSDATARLSWQAALGWSRRIDDDAYARASLVATGRDDLFEAGLHATFKVARNWSLHPYAAYAYNKSNIELYTFRKAEGGLALRYEMR